MEGILRLANSMLDEPVNVGNPREFTIGDFAELIISITGTKSEIVFKSLPVDDPKVRKPDISKARRELGWEPRVEVEEGLKKTIDWFRKTGEGCIGSS